MQDSTIVRMLLKAGADARAPRSARRAACRSPTARFARTSQTVVAALNAQGIGANDRVAIVLDNGPEMAAAFLGIGSAATAAPLNPTYRADEFEFYLTDLARSCSSSRRARSRRPIDVATKLGVPIARLVPTPENGRRQLRPRRSPRAIGRAARHAAGPRHARRHRARAAHVGHDVASQDRSARAQERLRVGGATSATRSRSRRTIAAS